MAPRAPDGGSRKGGQKGKFDVVMTWTIDRIGRSLVDLLHTIQHLEACKVDLYLDQQNIDTTTPMGKLIFQVTGAFAEFERSMITQRINLGIARARKHGTKSGAPIGRARIEDEIRAKVVEALAKGMSYRDAAAAADNGGAVHRADRLVSEFAFTKAPGSRF